MSIHYDDAGKQATVRPGAARALRARGWAGCYKHERDGERGRVAFVFLNGRDDHVAVEFDDGEVIAFPMECVGWQKSNSE